VPVRAPTASNNARRGMPMKRSTRWSVLLLVVLLLGVLLHHQAFAQAGFEDDRVILQGFYWESYRHGYPERFPAFGDKKWYDIVQQQAAAIREGRFDLIWLPPPSYAGEMSAGYNPKEYFKLHNSYGNFQQRRSALEALLQHGIEPIADIVINHRDGSQKWADFKNPDWGTWAITRHDEAFHKEQSEVFGTPVEQRGTEEEHPIEYAGHGGTTYGCASFRDIDHTNPTVRRGNLAIISFPPVGNSADFTQPVRAQRVLIAGPEKAAAPDAAKIEGDRESRIPGDLRE
jgi:alpha-amylase